MKVDKQLTVCRRGEEECRRSGVGGDEEEWFAEKESNKGEREVDNETCWDVKFRDNGGEDDTIFVVRDDSGQD